MTDIDCEKLLNLTEWLIEKGKERGIKADPIIYLYAITKAMIESRGYRNWERDIDYSSILDTVEDTIQETDSDFLDKLFVTISHNLSEPFQDYYYQLRDEGKIHEILENIFENYRRTHPEFNYTNYLKDEYVADLTKAVEIYIRNQMGRLLE